MRDAATAASSPDALAIPMAGAFVFQRRGRVPAMV